MVQQGSPKRDEHFPTCQSGTCRRSQTPVQPTHIPGEIIRVKSGLRLFLKQSNLFLKSELRLFLFGFSVSVCPLNLTMCCNTLPQRPLYLGYPSQDVGRVMTHIQARTGCGCEQQILKHEISSGSYLLWGKFEFPGTEEALKQEMLWQDSARFE